jgi:O-antigen/teichoic acid export membrane protein
MLNFLKIYLWQFISILFSFASIFVVTPYLSSNTSLFGIYSLVTAAYIFLSYADFGFLSAGMKFASESYAQQDIRQEIRIIGFTSFIFLIFVLIYTVVVVCLSFHPELLVKSLSDKNEIKIANQLLLILGVFSPVFVLQRMLQIIFAVRLQDYTFQKVLIFFNGLKITFAVLFFGKDNYPIVSFFLFSQLCTLGASLVGFIILKRKLNYDIELLLRNVRFSKTLYKKTKNLAFVSIFLAGCWILYYEMDSFVISRVLGAQYLAIYAIALSLMTYFRSIFGIIFSPFTAKFNHFVGLQDFTGLKEFFSKVICIGIPLTVFPVVAITLTIKNFILTWVGFKYEASIPIAQMLIFSYIFSFLIYPSGILVMAYERVKLLYLSSALLPIVYWTGIIVAFPFWGLQAFANFKFVSFTIAAIVYMYAIGKIFKLPIFSYMLNLFKPAALPIVFLVVTLLLLRPYMGFTQGKVNLILYFSYIGVVLVISFGIYYYTSIIFRQGISSMLAPLLSKNWKIRKLDS